MHGMRWSTLRSTNCIPKVQRRTIEFSHFSRLFKIFDRESQIIPKLDYRSTKACRYTISGISNTLCALAPFIGEMYVCIGYVVIMHNCRYIVIYLGHIGSWWQHQYMFILIFFILNRSCVFRHSRYYDLHAEFLSEHSAPNRDLYRNYFTVILIFFLNAKHDSGTSQTCTFPKETCRNSAESKLPDSETTPTQRIWYNSTSGLKLPVVAQQINRIQSQLKWKVQHSRNHIFF